jgi:membrane protease YdiL (CAAX protease family)
MSQNKAFDRIEWLKRFAFGRPVIFSILVILAAGALTEIPLDVPLAPLVGSRAAEFWRVIIGHSVTGLLLVGLVVKLDLLKEAGFTPPSQWKALWLAWPLAVLTLLNLSSLFDGSLAIDTSRPGLILLFAVLNLTIGFCEEVMGRGVVLTVVLQRWGNTRQGIYGAVLVSSALFGAAHIFNLVVGRLPLFANMTQVVYSFVFGLVFAACFLRNGTIWPMMLVHAAIDFGGGLRHISVGGGIEAAVANNTTAEALSTLIVGLPLLLYGLFILRKAVPVEGQTIWR